TGWRRLLTRSAAVAVAAVLGAPVLGPVLGAQALAPGVSHGATDAGTAVPAADARTDGPFAVARAHVTLVDPTRQTPPSGSYPGSPVRTIKTVIFYPLPSGRDTRGVRGAGPADRRFPLVVFAHGNSSNGPDNRPLLRRWASAGFVVAAPTFPL